jgi:hypothetical protein
VVFGSSFLRANRHLKCERGSYFGSLLTACRNLQEQEFGGLNNAQVRRLRQLASALETNPNATVSSRPPIKPGTRLVREWKQQVHTVEVDAGGYQYKGARYESLSEIARLITGTRWSGPLFFGLKHKPAKESMEVQ